MPYLWNTVNLMKRGWRNYTRFWGNCRRQTPSPSELVLDTFRLKLLIFNCKRIEHFSNIEFHKCLPYSFVKKNCFLTFYPFNLYIVNSDVSYLIYWFNTLFFYEMRANNERKMCLRVVFEFSKCLSVKSAFSVHYQNIIWKKKWDVWWARIKKWSAGTKCWAGTIKWSAIMLK